MPAPRRPQRAPAAHLVLGTLACAALVGALPRTAPAQGTPYCFGDGAGTACPCSNAGFPGGGCANSSFPGAILSTQGTSSLANDSLLMRCTLLPFDPSGSAILFQGTAQSAAGAGAPFGAGLQCVTGTVRRLGRKSLASGLAEFGPAAGDAALSASGGVTAPGTTLHYQVWYRDVLPGCGAGAFNLSNGTSVTWSP